MKNKYTRKQIVESINYWKKQLRAGNYKKINESGEEEIDTQLKSKAEEFLAAQLEEFTKKYKSITGWGKSGVGYSAKTDWICDSYDRGKELAEEMKKFARENDIDDLQKLASYIRYAYIRKSFSKTSKMDSSVVDHFVDILPSAFQCCQVDIGRPDRNVLDRW